MQLATKANQFLIRQLLNSPCPIWADCLQSNFMRVPDESDTAAHASNASMEQVSTTCREKEMSLRRPLQQRDPLSLQATEERDTQTTSTIKSQICLKRCVLCTRRRILRTSLRRSGASAWPGAAREHLHKKLLGVPQTLRELWVRHVQDA